jgi:hypothetical protein
MVLSSFARIKRANTGAFPADEIAITIGLLSTIEGIIKVHRSGESTTFTGMFASFAKSDTCAFYLKRFHSNKCQILSQPHSLLQKIHSRNDRLELNV